MCSKSVVVGEVAVDGRRVGKHWNTQLEHGFVCYNSEIILEGYGESVFLSDRVKQCTSVIKLLISVLNYDSLNMSTIIIANAYHIKMYMK